MVDANDLTTYLIVEVRQGVEKDDADVDFPEVVYFGRVISKPRISAAAVLPHGDPIERPPRTLIHLFR